MPPSTSTRRPHPTPQYGQRVRRHVLSSLLRTATMAVVIGVRAWAEDRRACARACDPPLKKKSASLPAGVGAVACPRSVRSRRAPGCASNARATGTSVWLNTQARIESGSTALPSSRAALQTSRSRGELPAEWAYRLRDRPAQTQNYSPTRIQAHFVSSFSSARDRPEGGTPDGDALCIA